MACLTKTETKMIGPKASENSQLELHELLSNTYVLITPTGRNGEDIGFMKTGNIKFIPADEFLSYFQSLLAIPHVDKRDISTSMVEDRMQPPKMDVGINTDLRSLNADNCVNIEPKLAKKHVGVNTNKTKCAKLRNVYTNTSHCDKINSFTQTKVVKTANIRLQTGHSYLRCKSSVNEELKSRCSSSAKTTTSTITSTSHGIKRKRCKSLQVETKKQTKDAKAERNSHEPTDDEINEVLFSVKPKVRLVWITEYCSNQKSITALEPVQYLDLYLLLLADFVHFSAGSLSAIRTLLQRLLHHLLYLTSRFEKSELSVADVIELDQTILGYVVTKGKWDFKQARTETLAERSRKKSVISPKSVIPVISKTNKQVKLSDNAKKSDGGQANDVASNLGKPFLPMTPKPAWWCTNFQQSNTYTYFNQAVSTSGFEYVCALCYQRCADVSLLPFTQT